MTLPNLDKTVTKDPDPPATDTTLTPISPPATGTTALTTLVMNKEIDNINELIDYISGENGAGKIPVLAIDSNSIPYDFILWQTGVTTTFNSLNVATGVITSGTDERLLLQDDIDVLETADNGGVIFIKKPGTDFQLDGGIIIQKDNIYITGEVPGTSTQSSNNTVIFQSGTINATLVEFRLCNESGISNIQFQSNNTGQTGLKLEDIRRGSFGDLTFSGVFANAMHLRGETGLTATCHFSGKIHIQNAIIGMLFDANSAVMGDSISATVNYFEYVVMTGCTSKGVWFANKCDNNTFSRLQIASPGAAGFINIESGSATGNSVGVASNTIYDMIGGTADATDIVINIYDDTGQTDHIPLTIFSYTRDGTTPTNEIVLNSGARNPVILSGNKFTDRYGGMSGISSIVITGAEFASPKINEGLQGSLKVPTSNNGTPTNAQFGDVTGCHQWDELNGRAHWLSKNGDGLWHAAAMVDFLNVYTANQKISVIGSPANWQSERDELLTAGTNIAQYRFQSRDSLDSGIEVYAQIDGRVSTNATGNRNGYLVLKCATANTAGQAPADHMLMRGNLAHPTVLFYTVDFKGQDTTSGDKPALRIFPSPGDPTTLLDGDVWYNSTSNKFRVRENGVSVDQIGGGAITWTDTIACVMEVPQGTVGFPDVHAMTTTISKKLSGFVMPDGASTSTINFKCILPDDVASTPNATLRFRFLTLGAVTATDLSIVVRAKGFADGEDADVAFDTDEAEAIVRMPDANDSYDYYNEVLGGTFASNDTLHGQIDRRPQDADDDYTDDVLLVGVDLLIDRTI